MAKGNYWGSFKKAVVPLFGAAVDDYKDSRDKTLFPYDGTHIYAGWQGSGKTASMVKHGVDLKYRYPRCILVSNLALSTHEPVSIALDGSRTGLTMEDKQHFLTLNLIDALKTFKSDKQYFTFTTGEELAVFFRMLRNGRFGIMYMLDEAHLYFNSLESKDISPEIFATISQQRKNTTIILGSSQLFMRLAKPIREQASSVIMCRTFLGFITLQKAYDAHVLTQDDDGKLHGDVKKRGWFFHSRALREAYNTYQIVISSQQLYETPNIINVDTRTKKSFGRK